MNSEDRAVLTRLLIHHGVQGVVSVLRELAEEKAKDYPPDAIIHEHTVVLRQAEQQCLSQVASRIAWAMENQP